MGISTWESRHRKRIPEVREMLEDHLLVAFALIVLVVGLDVN